MTLRNLPLVATTLVFVLGYAICVAVFPNMFSLRVAGNLLTDSAVLGVLAIGMAFVIISGGIDLSMGAVMGLSSVLVALAVTKLGLHPLAAFALAIGFGLAFGAGMGAAIHSLKAPAFIVTLTAQFLARGVGFLLTTQAVAIDHPFYAGVSNLAIHLPGGGRLGVVALIMLAAFVAGCILLHFTRFGSDVFAVGGDRRAARLTGAPVGRATVAVYAISGGAAALAGVMTSLNTGAAYPLTGVGSELDAIAAVVIGGALLSGGSGALPGALLGVLIQGLIIAFINFDGRLSSWWAKIITGLLLFGFIALQRLLVRYSSSLSQAKA